MTGTQPLRDRLTLVLERWSGRPTLFAIAVMNAITGLGFAVKEGHDVFGADSGLYRQCAVLLADGQTEFCGFLYSPLTALVARPLTWVAPVTAMLTMTLIGAGIVVAGVILETRGQAVIDRILVAVAALTFAPVVFELLLGQTTMPIAATIYLFARRPDSFRSGIPFGVALALAPKPLLFPVLLWMLVWRRRALTASAATALLLTAVGVGLLGFAQYLDWISVLAGAGSASVAGTFILATHEMGNFSMWPFNPATILLAGGVVAATLWTILRDAERGLVAALLAGLLLAPYSLLYAFSILLLAAKPAFKFAPRATRLLALTANLAGYFLSVLTVWTLSALYACVSINRSGLRWPKPLHSRNRDENR